MTFDEGKFVKTPDTTPSTPQKPATPLTPYMKYFEGRNIPFWTVIGLALLGLFSVIFVLFADRNEEVVSFWKTFLKGLMSIVVGVIGFWIATFFVSYTTSQIVGAVIAIFFFISLWSALGWIKSFLVTILTLICFIVILAIGGLIVRAFFTDLLHFLAWLS